MVIASPIAGINKANKKHIATKARVTKALILLFIPVFFQNNSSTVSFAGNTHKGDAVSTAKNKAKFPYYTYIY